MMQEEIFLAAVYVPSVLTLPRCFGRTHLAGGLSVLTEQRPLSRAMSWLQATQWDGPFDSPAAVGEQSLLSVLCGERLLSPS